MISNKAKAKAREIIKARNIINMQRAIAEKEIKFANEYLICPQCGEELFFNTGIKWWYFFIAFSYYNIISGWQCPKCRRRF
jgi:rubrerythrin